METKLNVTKGVVTASKKVSRDTILAEYSSRVYNDNGEPMAIVIGRSESETKDNALLVEDSFNTHNTTGKTPSELLQEMDELLEALRINDRVITSLKLSMLAHPDCEDGSEFDDMTETAEDRNILNAALIQKHSTNV